MEELSGEGRSQASTAAGREHVHGDAVAVVLLARQGGRLDGFEPLGGGRLGEVMFLLFRGFALAVVSLVDSGLWRWWWWWRKLAAENIAEALVFFVGAGWSREGLARLQSTWEAAVEDCDRTYTSHVP